MPVWSSAHAYMPTVSQFDTVQATADIQRNCTSNQRPPSRYNFLFQLSHNGCAFLGVMESEGPLAAAGNRIRYILIEGQSTTRRPDISPASDAATCLTRSQSLS